MRVFRILCAILGAAALARDAEASRGLSTKFANVEVKNLKIGKTYSLQQVVNFPLRIINTGSDSIDIKVTVVPPTSSGEGKEGYEALDDTSWIHLSQSTFTVFPNMEAVSDVVISVPNDEKLLGRRFIVYLWTQSQNVGLLGVGLKSRMLLSISSQKPTAEELKQKFVESNLANLNFGFAPMEVSAENVPVGKTVSLADYDADMKVSNPNKKKYHFRITPVGLWETTITPPGGYQFAPDPKWLIVEKSTFAADGFSFTPLDLKLNIPDKPEFRGKGFELAVRAEILEQPISAYSYGTLLIRTKK